MHYLLLGGPSDLNGTYATEDEGLALGYDLPDVLTQVAWGDELVLVWEPQLVSSE